MTRLLALAALLAVPARAGFLEDLAAQEASIKEQAGQAQATETERLARNRAFEPAKTPKEVEAAIADEAGKLASKDKAYLVDLVKGYEDRVDELWKKDNMGCQTRVEMAQYYHADVRKQAARLFGPTIVELERYLDAIMAELAANRAAPGSRFRRTLEDQSILTEIRRRYPRSLKAEDLIEEAEKAAQDELLYPAADKVGYPAALQAVRQSLIGKRVLYRGNNWRNEEGELLVRLYFDEDQPRVYVCSGRWEPGFTYWGQRYGYMTNPDMLLCVRAGMKDGVKSGLDPASAANNRIAARSKQYTDEIFMMSAGEFAAYEAHFCIALEAARRALAAKP